jgi:hypothetical protein
VVSKGESEERRKNCILTSALNPVQFSRKRIREVENHPPTAGLNLCKLTAMAIFRKIRVFRGKFGSKFVATMFEELVHVEFVPVFNRNVKRGEVVKATSNQRRWDDVNSMGRPLTTNFTL